jgi:hypothetical protein
MKQQRQEYSHRQEYSKAAENFAKDVAFIWSCQDFLENPEHYKKNVDALANLARQAIERLKEEEDRRRATEEEKYELKRQIRSIAS